MLIMKVNNNTKTDLQKLIKEALSKLNKKQFKIFYTIIIHCHANNKLFISTQNLFNLWCELNVLCAEFDESFPDQYDDHLLIKSFCITHPYYFLDILPHKLITKLFSEHLDKHLKTLLKLIQIIHKDDLKSACHYIIDKFSIDHTADELLNDLEEHIIKHS